MFTLNTCMCACTSCCDACVYVHACIWMHMHMHGFNEQPTQSFKQQHVSFNLLSHSFWTTGMTLCAHLCIRLNVWIHQSLKCVFIYVHMQCMWYIGKTCQSIYGSDILYGYIKSNWQSKYFVCVCAVCVVCMCVCGYVFMNV